jgi:hypothetical protein
MGSRGPNDRIERSASAARAGLQPYSLALGRSQLRPAFAAPSIFVLSTGESLDTDKNIKNWSAMRREIVRYTT